MNFIYPTFLIDFSLFNFDKKQYIEISKLISYNLTKKFKNIVKGQFVTENFDSFEKKLFSKDTNSFLFYLGLEKEIRNSHIKFEEFIKKKFPWFFNNDDLYSFYTIKTVVSSKDKSNRLLSILLKVVNISIDYKVVYIMFPFDYGNFHNK